MSGADLRYAMLSKADLQGATLSGASLRRATLSEANLHGARLSEANLTEAMLSGANLTRANLSYANMNNADLSGAFLTRAFLTTETNLDGVTFSQPPVLVGARWNGAPLDDIDWAQVTRLGDDEAISKAKTRQERAEAYRGAARAYHGLVVALETQGLTEPARRFRQRERLLERRALRAQPRTCGSFLFYALLNLISGQGEAPERIFAAYALIVGTFTVLYWWVSHAWVTSSQPLRWYEALVLSLSSFHGRGFFPSQIGLGDPLAIVAAVDAVLGLFIELILIATFSNRFLNR